MTWSLCFLIFTFSVTLHSTSSTHSQSHKTEYPFLKLYFETLNQTSFCLSPSLSLPTLFAQFLSLNLLFDPIRTITSGVPVFAPFPIPVTTHSPTYVSFSYHPLAFSGSFVLYILFGKFHPGLIPYVSFPAGKLLEKIMQSSEHS